MAARFLLALAFANALSEAKHITVPLEFHHGNDQVHSHALQGAARFAAVDKSSTFVIEPATLANNTFWYGYFDVGDSKNLRLALDTGSPAVELNPNLYKPSSQARNLHSSGNVSYTGTMPDGCGVLEIFYAVYEDTVTVQNLTAVNQHLLTTFKHKSPGSGIETQMGPPFQGIMGLDENNQDHTYDVGGRPFFGNLCHQKQVDECRFGIAFGTSGKGKMLLGGLDSSLFNDSLRKSPLQQDQEWVVAGAVASSGSIVERNQSFTLDTGTPNVLGSIKQVRKLFEKAGIQGVEEDIPSCGKVLFGYYPCNNPPTIGFTVGGTVFNIETSAFALHNNGNNNCTTTIVGLEEPGYQTSWTLGQAWMQGKYFDFDITSRQVGAALLKDPVRSSY